MRHHGVCATDAAARGPSVALRGSRGGLPPRAQRRADAHRHRALAYALGQGWNVVDALYFAVATLTTTSVSDPELVLTDRWLKLFTVFYILIGIGVLVEIVRRLGFAFVAVRAEEKAQASQQPDGPPTATG
jgi:hypothetical protein